MPKLPYMQFYPGDYVRDTRCLSLAARGAWMDILCALWHAPKRGQRTLTLAGWAGEIGKALDEVSVVLNELEANEICKITHENNSKMTILSRRMVRDERARNLAAKRQQKQRDSGESRSESRSESRLRHSNVTGIYQKSEVRSQKSEEERERKKEKKEKIVGEVRDLARPPKSELCWQRYRGSYLQVWGVEPMRNKHTNIALCGLVDRLGVEVAPEVAGFYPFHTRSLYVTAKHPPNLLLRDAETLCTEFLRMRDGHALVTAPRSVAEMIG